MNAADPRRSPRLHRLLAVLGTGHEYSTRQLIARADVCAINSAVAELRTHGLVIHCQPREGNWWYRLDHGATYEVIGQHQRAARRLRLLADHDAETDAEHASLSASADAEEAVAARIEDLLRGVAAWRQQP